MIIHNPITIFLEMRIWNDLIDILNKMYRWEKSPDYNDEKQSLLLIKLGYRLKEEEYIALKTCWLTLHLNIHQLIQYL